MSKYAHIIVLGDIVRSPRMCAHANQLHEEGWNVDVFAYSSGQTPFGKRNIRIRRIPELNFIKKLPFGVLSLALRLVLLTFLLLIKLCFSKKPNLLIAQTPPAIPTFFVLVFISHLRNIPLIIDWHNYGYTIINSDKSRANMQSGVYRFLELSTARRYLKDPKKVQHLCVSNAMCEDIHNKMALVATVVYDRPLDSFQPTSAEKAHDLFTHLSREYPTFSDSDKSCRRTRFTEITTLADARFRWRADRPKLIVSSCSWTPDDDMTMLMSSLDDYDKAAAKNNSGLPPLVCALTGKGPCRQAFQELVAAKRYRFVEVIFPWLSTEDYPAFLGCADLGISLHQSTSDIDLPMKVVDLLGCCVPVLALGYPALSELLQDGLNGKFFDSSATLSKQLQYLMHDEGSSDLEKYCRNIKKLRNSPTWNWSSEWRMKVLPLIEQLQPSSTKTTKLD